VGQELEIDVRPHPDFGIDSLKAHLRWFVHSDFVHTIGVLFRDPLARGVPILLPASVLM